MGDVEAIVVIDGPDAASQHALARIGDARLRVIALPESVGGSEARNIGARAAASRWIALLDDDDEWLLNKCGAAVACRGTQRLGLGSFRYAIRYAAVGWERIDLATAFPSPR